MSKKITKIFINPELCIGAASCLGVAPEAYELNEESIAVLKTSWKELTDDLLIQSAQSCPTKAIFLFDKERKQIFP